LHSMEDLPSSPATESATVSEVPTPLTQSGRTSPASLDDHLANGPPITAQKKKKKKKPKKSSTPKVVAEEIGKGGASSEARPQTLCISRNKHWKYISSYHVCAQPVCRLTGAGILPGPLATTSGGIARYPPHNELEPCRPRYASDLPFILRTFAKKATRPHRSRFWRFYSFRVTPYHIFSSTASSSFITSI